MPPKEEPLQDLYVLTDLEQIKVLADPLRLRILENLDRERTTKQVAELIGEKPTRLYHHIEALERVGVIRLIKTRQNRGTVEKYYQAVARMFRADPGLFRAEQEGQAEAIESMLTSVFDNTSEELRRLIKAGKGANLENEGILSYCEVRASQEEIDRIREEFESILQRIKDQCCVPEAEEKEGDRRYRLTAFFFPLVDASSADDR